MQKLLQNILVQVKVGRFFYFQHHSVLLLLLLLLLLLELAPVILCVEHLSQSPHLAQGLGDPTPPGSRRLR
jgi:hypothetical protein